ncbi:MAG: UbiA family prenyltransferase [Thermoplasmatota archaeon]
MSGRFLDVLSLYRLHTALVTAAVPGIASYIAGGPPIIVASVVIGSVLHHAWGFSLNEIIDYRVDRTNPDLAHKPLVSGRLSKNTAWLLSFGALALSIAFFTGGALLGGGVPLVALILLLAATLAGWVYDLYGKRFPLSDVFVAAWMFFLVLAGAGSVSGWGPYPVAVWACASLGALHILFNNSVEGGLKDVENDRKAGARTLAVVTRVRIRKGTLRVPTSFMVWGFLLRALFVIGASVFVLFITEGTGVGIWILVAVPLIGLFLAAHSMTFLGRSTAADRGRLIRTFALHEIASFGLSMLVILPAAGVVPAGIAFTAPLAWVVVFNRLIFGTRLVPKV